MIDEARLIEPPRHLDIVFGEFELNDDQVVHVDEAGLVVLDPGLVVDIVTGDDASASYIREQGVLAMEFGGDDMIGLIVQCSDTILIPMSDHYGEGDSIHGPDDMRAIECRVGCDGGTFAFISNDAEMPVELGIALRDCVASGTAAHLYPEPGAWKLYYEQFDCPDPGMEDFYRNIVFRRV